LNHRFRDYTLILFALSTGLRNSEIIGLNAENVYPFGSVVSILELPAEIAKGKKSRSIPFNDKIKSVLDFYIRAEYNFKNITNGKSPLFRSAYTKKRIGSRDFQQILKKHANNSIKRHCNPHMLRHTFATKLIRQANIKIVQEILGHKCLQSTQIYLHPSATEKIEAVNKLNF